MRYQPQLVNQQPIASTKPQLFQSLAQRFSAFASKAQDDLDRDMQKKAKEQGLIDAQGKTAITLRDGSTIADEAWNQGAISSHLAAIKLDVTDNLSRIAAENARNPEGYTVNAKAYSKGLLEGVPENIRPAVQDELSSIILKSNRKIESDLVSFERDQHAASTSTAIDLYRTEGENQALLGDVVGATDAQIKAIQLTDSLEIAGLLTPKAAEAQRKAITQDIEDQVIYGAFSREMEKGKGLKYINNFKKIKRLGGRDPDYRKKMADKMVGLMKAEHATDDAIRRQEDADRKARWREGAKQIATLDLNGDLIIEHLQDMVKNDQLDPKVANAYKKNAFLEGLEFSEQVAINEIKADILAVSELEIQTDTRLSRIDKGKLIQERRSLEEDKGNWRSTQNGREGARRINQAFGIIKGVDSRITAEKARRAGMVLTRYFNEIEALPLEEREYKTVEIADKLVKEVNSEISIADLEKARDRLNKAQYQTEEQIKAAELGSEEEKTQIIQLNRKLKRIERLEREIGQ